MYRGPPPLQVGAFNSYSVPVGYYFPAPFMSAPKNPPVRKYTSRLTISKNDIKNCLHLPQSQAARYLGTSVSTLKKRFKEFYPGKKWPYKPYGRNLRSKAIAEVEDGVDARHKISFLCNDKNEEVDERVCLMLQYHVRMMGGR